MNKTLTIIFVLASIITLPAFSCEKDKADCGGATPWYNGNRIELLMTDEQSRNISHWHIKLYSSNDIIIEKDEEYQGRSVQGTLGVIGGKMMITKGLELKNGYEIDAADGPGLMIQLVLRLLGEVAPEGPSEISENVNINYEESSNDIKVATAAASAVFGAPWNVTGTIASGQDSKISYNLEFTSKIGGENYNLLLSGTWENDSAIGRLSGDMNISDWRVYKIGPYTKKYKGGTIYDYGAQPLSESFNNLAALRDYIDNLEKSSAEK